MIAAFALASLLAAPQRVVATATGSLSGTVLAAPHSAHLAKTVWVGSIATPVAADGSFRADRLPQGPVELAIETSEGLYVVATAVTIAPGLTRRVQLAMSGRQDSSAPAPPEKDKKKRVGVWANPAAATLIIIGSAIVVGFAVDQLTKPDQQPVSQSTPTN